MSFRLRKIQAAWLSLILLAAFVAAVGAIAQTQQAERGEWRYERRIEALDKGYNDLRLDNEKRWAEVDKRWAAIETKLGLLQWLLSGIGIVIVGQLGRGLWDAVGAMAARRQQSDK